MALKIKGSFLLNSTNTNTNFDNEVFTQFMDNISHSWKVKNDESKEINIYKENLDTKKYKINYTPDLLKQKSLITYIDAPWGSGKTYFIENMISWLSMNDMKFDFGKGSTELDVDLIDAWEIYNGQNINEILFSIFKINFYDDTFKANINSEAEKISKNLKDEKYLEKIKGNINRYSNIVSSALTLLTANPVAPIIINGVKKISNISIDGKINNDKKYIDDFDDYFNGREYSKLVKNYALSSVLIKTLNERFLKNEKMIIIDNIERLSTENRLDVINKIINWSNVSGVTFIFLTNFDRIKLAKVFEEDFWNKISLHSTFKLTNSWEMYLSNYKSKTKKLDFSHENIEKLVSFIKEIIPTFFSGNKDNMDIREIKKLLDNWKFKGVDDFEDPSKLIISFISEMIEYNLIGLDKYFFINRVVSILCEKNSNNENEFWNLWKDEFLSEISHNKFVEFKAEDEEGLDCENNIGIYNNKMLRIQSNFYKLKLIKNEDRILIKEESLNIENDERRSFMEFNNFIDENATNKFEKLFKDISKTRKITNPENYIWKYMELTGRDEIDYFEFKYNSIEKIFMYNKIINYGK